MAATNAPWASEILPSKPFFAASPSEARALASSTASCSFARRLSKTSPIHETIVAWCGCCSPSSAEAKHVGATA
eukprot:6103102-Alexandrium_andersonii.AAC.1